MPEGVFPWRADHHLNLIVPAERSEDPNSQAAQRDPQLVEPGQCMIRTPGGFESGAISTRSSPRASAASRATSMGTIPLRIPSASMSRTCRRRIWWLMRGCDMRLRIMSGEATGSRRLKCRLNLE
jgi:hypothetical protein